MWQKQPSSATGGFRICPEAKKQNRGDSTQCPDDRASGNGEVDAGEEDYNDSAAVDAG